MNGFRFWLRAGFISLMAIAIYGFLQIPSFFERFRTKKSINILMWPNVMDAQYFADFEKKTGIKVYLSYFESYEELLVKIRSGSGDYDLVMAADYAVDLLVKEGAVKPIDKTKLTFWKQLYPVLLNLYYDPENRYTIPFAWEMYGIGVDTNYYDHQLPKASWGLLFDPNQAPKHVGMLDDAREMVSVAALYLFGKKKTKLDEQDLKAITSLLLNQKKRVAMYTDLRTDYLLVSGSAPIVMGISSDIYNAMRKHANISFLLPKEGSFMVVDTLLLPATTKKDDLVYQFLNFLYDPEIIKRYADRYSFFPALKGVGSDKGRFLLTPTRTLLSQLRFFNYIIPEQGLRELWIALKS
jgi:spermidine/putrescine-binding protein